MTIVTTPFKSFEDAVISNMETTPQLGQIVHVFGEFAIVPPQDKVREFYGTLNNNATNPTFQEVLNVKLG